ncbi:unnamed protein product, partial [Meganyctiphanes norvegica]
IVLNSLKQNLSPGTCSSVIEYDDVIILAPTPHVVFLTLNQGSTILGSLHIRLDGQPRRAQQFLELSTGRSGRGSYRNASITKRNTSTENLYCEGYINAFGKKETCALYKVEEKWTGKEQCPEGIVFGSRSENSSSFWIVTKEE